MGIGMSGAVRHDKVVQQVETRVYCHKGKYFVLEPIVAFVAIWKEVVEFKE